ncbi:MAG: RNA methyltransferase [Planctomycetaceae bacterium]|nr:RNA methyltransferase [Planctomycetaceae bacterium]
MIAREELLSVKRIASRANPRVKDWAGLGDRKNRDALGLTLAEGAKLAWEALQDGAGRALLRPVTLLVSDSGAERPEAGELYRLAGAMQLERISLADDVYDKISGLKNADGLAVVLSIAREAVSLPELFATADARWLVAAGVQDPGNAGALARTALAAGCGGCLFLDGADPFSPKFLRGSMGAAFRLACLGATTDEFVAAWPELNARLVMAATEGNGALPFRDVDYQPPLALLVGGERGVPDELAALADVRAHIPLQGGVESLNLAVAAGIVLFEAERHWRAKQD